MTDPKPKAMTVDEAVEWAKDAAVLAQLYREKNYGPAIIKEKEERDIQALATLEALAESEAGLRAENATLKQEEERLTAPDNKTLMRLAQDLGVEFSAAKIIHDKAWREAEAELSSLRSELDKAKPLTEAVEKAEIELRSWIDDSGEQVFRYNEAGDTDIILRAALAHLDGREG